MSTPVAMARLSHVKAVCHARILPSWTSFCNETHSINSPIHSPDANIQGVSATPHKLSSLTDVDPHDIDRVTLSGKHSEHLTYHTGLSENARESAREGQKERAHV
jgi:hypothetical protein